MDRRTAIRASAALLASACSLPGEPVADTFADGRITRRPAGGGNTLAPGTHPLRLGAGARDGLLHVPPHEPAAALPLLLLLHGAGSSAAEIVAPFRAHADARGVLLLAPDSRGPTWDAVAGEGFGYDVAFIDDALQFALARCRVDPARYGTAGFSDGASYALSLGLINGDVFTHAAAFAPGMLLGDYTRGRPRAFMSHGTADAVLPIDLTARPIARWLEGRGHPLAYHEHAGGHQVAPAHLPLLFDWLLA